MKRILLSISLMTAFMLTVNAQVILLDADEGSCRSKANTNEVPFIPLLGVTYDQYAPMADGAAFLCCLGGAYLLKKRRKKKL